MSDPSKTVRMTLSLLAAKMRASVRVRRSGNVVGRCHSSFGRMLLPEASAALDIRQ
jgi:hypothetical protein